ncbi:type I restriction-modification system, M subunit [mine drainage metagenome]|uniref:site-specific DNA-methyltransferase (adenine-specific) n=2 Tax=mine drainage metagenome TaxID=410659 RepID=T0ZAW8_9ZZZZ
MENRLWAAADQLWANTGLKPSEFSTPVLGLIFLRYADTRYAEADAALAAKGIAPEDREPMDYQAEGVLYLPEDARFAYLQSLTEGADLGRHITRAMTLVEDHNPELRGVLPRGYNALPNATLVELLRLLAPLDLQGDAFGKVYEYFLGNFALKEGQKGGVFYTPTSIVRLIVEIIQPFHGRIFDPACGSGGMFVQSAEFVRRHQRNATTELTVFGTEKAADTVKLAKMNLAVHGLSGDIRESNTYYEDPHKAVSGRGANIAGRFDFVMANPPFNVSGVDKDRLKDDARFALGLPSTDNANYLWIQLFHAALNDSGRAGFVMANSAGDARGGELEIRKKLIQGGAVDVIVSVGSNFFYTVTLPCTLWFFDKSKCALPPSPPGRGAEAAGLPSPTGRRPTEVPKGGAGGEGSAVQVRRRDTILFIDARPFFKQVTRAIREFTPEQMEFLANIVRLYRGAAPELEAGSAALLAEKFPESHYRDVAGLCKAATRAEIEAQGWSLNPGRYVGVGERAADGFDFKERLEALQEELVMLGSEAHSLEETIAARVAAIVSGES